MAENVGEAAKSMLEEWADLVFECDDGTEILACRFVCGMTCPLLKDLMEAVDIPHEPGSERRRIKLPGAACDEVKLALQVVHGAISFVDFDLSTTLLCRRGMRFLACTLYDSKLLDRMLELVLREEDVESFLEHLGDFLASESHRSDALWELIRRRPLFEDVRRIVSTRLDVDLDVAKFLMASLVKFFPPASLFKTLLRAVPEADLTPNAAMELASVPHTGMFYHPCEIVEVMSELKRIFAARGWDTHLCNMLGIFVAGSEGYFNAPAFSSGIVGTTVMYENLPMTSVLLQMTEHLDKMTSICVSPWLRVRIDPVSGAVHATIRVRRIDDYAHVAKKLQVRITATQASSGGRDDKIAEVWYVWNALPARTVMLESCDKVVGNHAALQGLVAADYVCNIRIDLFYGDKSILVEPLVES
jgi:hypothetical protein